MEKQTVKLVQEWSGVIGHMVNPSSLENNTTQVQELFDGKTYSRVHRKGDSKLLVEEREKGSLYPRVWEMTQDFSELDLLLKSI